MKTVAVAGAGGRCYHTYAMSLVRDFSDLYELRAAFDRNILRARYYHRTISPGIAPYDDFGLMLDEVRPDVVVVTTVDGTHGEYVVRALERGCDVVCEKPLATTVQSCRDIVAAERASAGRVRVTFNCRFMPYIASIKALLRGGAVGRVLSVNYEYLLGTDHGSDYFRRWHRRMANSGSLLVHKSTHHFDIANWLLEDEPELVGATGSLHYFGPNREMRGERCMGCAHAGECEYYRDFFKNSLDRGLYLECESADGYHRDGCPFSPEVDIFDNMSVWIRYCKGALLTYSLTTYNPYEGYRISITGTEGRLEAEEFMTGPDSAGDNYFVRLYDVHGGRRVVEFPKAGGAHGGGDERMLRMIFRGGEPDELGQCASTRDGVASAMCGISARESILTGKVVNAGSILRDIFAPEGTKC